MVQRLSQAFSVDLLTLEELERRLEQAYRARSVDELAALTVDLSPASAAALVDRPAGVSAPPSRVLPPVAPEDYGRLLSLFSQTVKAGPWIPPRKLEARAYFSELVLDLREARLAAGVTEIDLVAFAANVRILVPPDVRVVDHMLAVMASVRNETLQEPAPDAAAPVLRVRGSAVMAEVVMRVRN